MRSAALTRDLQRMMSGAFRLKGSRSARAPMDVDPQVYFKVAPIAAPKCLGSWFPTGASRILSSLRIDRA
jgi:hypothetical protein